MTQRIILIGFGNVGRGLAQILVNKEQELNDTYGYRCAVVGITTPSLGTLYNENGLDLKKILADLEAGNKITQDNCDWDTATLIQKSNASVVCELSPTNLETGLPAIDFCRLALETGKHVVCCNKGPAALAYADLAALAKEKGLRFLIEGTVMSGTPALNLGEGPLAGCTITAARGILNGTTNYILTRMEEGMSYEDALKKAQELGYAETDPTGDVEGHDAQGKVAILANVVMRTPLKLNEVTCKGITGLTADDIKQAQKENCRWKLIGSVKKEGGKVIASVAPEKLPLTDPLASVNDAANAMTFTTDLLGDVSIVGPGAGKVETGFSVLTDLLSLPKTT